MAPGQALSVGVVRDHVGELTLQGILGNRTLARFNC